MDKEKRIVLPGDSVAVQEEFLPGKNVYEIDGTIRALLAGKVVRDVKNREVHIEPVTLADAPSVGDFVTGQVESVQSSSANLKIYYLNGKHKPGGFSGVIFLRDERAGRGARRTQVTLGDIVRAKVASTLNAIIQLSIQDNHAGVVFTHCSNCGTILARGNGRSKCVECGSVEDRKFADDFGAERVDP